jgi:flagellar basal body-associated protein FliL
MNDKRGLRWYAIMIIALMVAPTFLVPAEDIRAEDIIFHVSTFSDGKPEKNITFKSPGTDKSSVLNFPNGARVISATMNISGQPYAPGGTDYPENLTVDVGNDGNLEWAYQGTGYGDLGRQNEFVSGNIKSNVPVGAKGTNTTFFYIPAGANISGANCTVKCPGGIGSGMVNITGGSGANTYPFGQQAFRFQYLYIASELGTSGILDKLAFKNSYSSAPSGQGTFSNFKMLFCNTPITSLTTTYASNYGGNTPVKVIDSPEYTVNDPNSYLEFDPSNDFFYDNSMNLLIEVSLTARSGNPYDMSNAAATGNRRAYYMGAADAPTASGVSASRADCRFEFIVKTNMTFDLYADSIIEYTNPDGYWNNTDLSFSQTLSNFMATAPLNFTDAYGIGFVIVPISVSMEFGGMTIVSNLSVTYEYAAVINESPALGNLAKGIDAVLPKKYDGMYSNIMVAVSSNHTGKVKLSGVSIDFIPPIHAAIIESRTPEDAVVLMDENTTLEFHITATDPFNYPINITWTVNNNVVLKNSFNLSWHADFASNGTHNITVSVDNGMQKVATSWMLIVRNVNRKPLIDSFSPEKKSEMDENSSTTFEISASDPDNDAFSITWYADAKRVLTDETILEYKTTYSSAGKHEVKVVLLDAIGGSTTLAWNITVNDVNAVPIIADSSPPGDEVTMSENSVKKFSVVDQSPDGDKQFIQWSLDGNNTGATGRSYDLSVDFESAGAHVVQAEVSDGRLSEKRIWNVIVLDVNRPPAVKIVSPEAQAEFLLGADIVLDGTASSDPDGDALSMTWSDSGKMLGTGATLTVRLAKGRHLITLKVDDGKKGGNATAQVEIFVRYFDFKGTLTTNILSPTEGQKISVTITLTNKGDGTLNELPLSFSVDGMEVSTTTIENIEPGSDFPLEFQWKAVKGDHKLEISVNDQNFSQTITVAKKTAPSAGGDMLMPVLAVVIVAVIVLAAGAAIFAGRKKRAAPPPEEETEAPEESEVAIPYKPVRKAAAAPATRPRPISKPAVRKPPVPAPIAAPAPVPQVPAMTDDAKALEAIENTERILADAEKAGLDISKARQSLKIARNFFEMGKYQKAMLYCQNAEDSIE